MTTKTTLKEKEKEKVKVKTKSKDKTKIFVVDDHPIVRQGLALLINQEKDMEMIDEAGSAAEAIEKIRKSQPDFMIVDISLTGTSGLDLTKSILAQFPTILILVISMHDESLYVERVLRAGAKGYLMKQEATDNVVSAIRKIIGGDIYVSEKTRDDLVHKFINRNNDASPSSPESLSDRELEVLQFIGQGFSTRQIAEQMFISIKTIESHYAHIKLKLDLKNSHELIQYAVKWSLSKK